MTIKDLIGKNIQMEYEGKTVMFVLKEVNDELLVGKTPTNLDIYIPRGKVGPFMVGNFNRLYVHNCKNEGVCKGYRMLSTAKEVGWQCKHGKKFKCSIICSGEFDTLPQELRTKFLDGLHTTIPVIDKD